MKKMKSKGGGTRAPARKDCTAGEGAAVGMDGDAATVPTEAGQSYRRDVPRKILNPFRKSARRMQERSYEKLQVFASYVTDDLESRRERPPYPTQARD